MRSAVVVGTGLIGTSIALSLRARDIDTYLLDTDPVAARIAEARGAGSAGKPPETVDIAVLAVPPALVGPALARAQRDGLARCYTDAASVKALPAREAERHGCDPSTVVGGHPMAGGERSGPLAARPDLFEGKPWILVPTESTTGLALNSALHLVSLCGAMPVLLDADEHDRAVALVSHAPHLISSLAAARLMDGREAELRLAGQGLRDVIRIAGGSPELWTDILSANAGPVAAVLEAFAADLLDVVGELRHLADDRTGRTRRPALAELAELTGLTGLTGRTEPAGRTDGRTVLTAALRRGAAGRERVGAATAAPFVVRTAMKVTVGRAPGELARFFGVVTAVGGTVDGVDADGGGDRVSVSLPAVATGDLLAELRRNHWAAADTREADLVMSG